MRTTLRRHTSVKLAVMSLLLGASLAHASLPTGDRDSKSVRATHLASAAGSTATPRSSVTRSADFRARLSKPDVKSSSVLVMDERDSAILYSRQADVALPIASITKLMTALVVLDAQQPMDEEIEITKDDRDSERNSGSRLAIGTKLAREDLLHVALMSSENRAAHALGRNYPGGLTAFVHAMNAKAKSLGMTAAHFVDPTGLSSDNVASPADLSKLVIAASHNETIRDFSTDPDYELRVGRRTVEFRNTNTLVKNPTWDIVVQKTGYITEAGKCLVMKAVIEGRSIVIVLLDSFGKYTRTADANRIRKWMEATQLSASRSQ